MKRAFLKAPVKFSRISSRYSNRRFHPVLKRYKGHYGTDYAAPHGTPIVAVANGVVTATSYTKNNGNYVKLRHDDVYETQYLHMQRFARGIRPGVHVSQGDVIGYVGATGLATGPHVCFRFWKNGRQVDHLRENLPPPEPMPDEDIPAFEKVKADILPFLRDPVYNSITNP
jgi:murein DD-endopeptidase MepM/ murein hydrolase activator NlpD